MSTLTPFLAGCFLFFASILSGTLSALLRLGRLQAEEKLKKIFPIFFIKYFLNFFFGKRKWEGLLFSLNFTKHLLRIGFVLTSFFFLLNHDLFKNTLAITSDTIDLINPLGLIGITGVILAISLISDFICSVFGQLKPWQALYVFARLSSFILLICVPLTALFFKTLKLFLLKSGTEKKLTPTFRIRDKVQELLQESELGAYLDTNEQKLILSVVSFKERIAREVMVPRIDIFSLSVDTPLEDAAQRFLQEGYSRIPTYRDNVDNIVGVLHYKDLLNVYVEHKEKQQKIETLIKPVLYTPETKKISQLLQEFRMKQIHLAIVVDEWGGTEGVVTIEDILEELVGEIADEYDVEHQELYTAIPDGGFVVDAKMSIIDIREELGVKIPQGPEYDTIGGYIFHRAGSIPSKGWKIHHDDFDLEVLSSSERSLNKIRITNIDTQADYTKF